MAKSHFVKVVTEGDPNSPHYRIYGYTDDNRTYLINHEILHLQKNQEKKS